jgi:ATP-dependent DNA helicase RecG
VAELLRKLGLETVRDLLYHFPHRYNDFSRLTRIGRLSLGEEATLLAQVWEVTTHSSRRGLEITEAVVGDDTGNIRVVWFNQPYLAKALKPQSRVVLSGKVGLYQGQRVLQHPEYELADATEELLHTGRIVPVYPLTEGLTPRRMRRIMKEAVEGWADQLGEFLPPEIRARRSLLDLPEAIRQIHFPASQERLTQARRRLAFDELLLLQLGMQVQKRAWREGQPGHSLVVDPALTQSFLASLPFSLTQGQRLALEAILADMADSRPMMRLLQGEVGSGKTVVALVALLVAVFAGYQGALMAPTEVLAEQHFHTISTLLAQAGLAEGGAAPAPYPFVPRVRLLTGSTKKRAREETLAAVALGEAHILVGTHAVIQEEVSFSRLGLAVIDEQHRFGVAQRAALRQKGYNPDVLVMTATPIPRTLALTLYADLDLCTIGELPPGRQQIQTRWLRPSQRQKAYDFIRRQVQEGRQAFIMCPLVDESEKIEARAAQEEHRRLSREVFPDLRLGLLHGRMRPGEKEQVMAQFRAGELPILVTTPVVEVGIDVPNATVMLVEGAERFGLAQLHQFRGRVGRGEHPSYCLLLEGNPSEEGRRRLSAIENTQDGFALAQADLDMRGPGEFLGTRQSGLPDLRIARLSDLALLELAREEASLLLASDPKLASPRHRSLARELSRAWKKEGVDFN